MGAKINRRCCLLMAWFCLSLGLASTPARVQAQAGPYVPVCVARADVARDARALLGSPADFDCRTPQGAFGPGDYDVLSVPLAGRPGTTGPVHARFASVWQDRVTLYALYADGAIARVALDGRGQSRALALGAIMDQPLPFRRVAVTRLLWRIEGSANVRGILPGASVVTADRAWRSDLMLGALYAGFGGLCLALLIHNLALWGALRHRLQLAYCAMMALMMLYALSSSGALAWIWPGLANTDRLRINYVLLGCSGAAVLAFARSYFEPAVFAGWTGRLSRLVVAGLVGSSALFAALAPWHAWTLDRLCCAVYVALLATAGLMLVRARRQRSPFLWLFACAWAAPFLFTGYRIAAAFGLLPWSFWSDNSTIGSMACEGLLSSLAVAYRIHLLSRERDQARERERAARLLADSDPLTGLLNRRALLDEVIGRAGDQTLVIVDVDHFKLVNETIGHDGGDEVLRIVARELRRAAGGAALVARLGGEEFAIIAPSETSPDPDQLLSALRRARMPFDLSVTASIGSCTGPLACEVDWKKLYRGADQALFAAKSAGRDRARDATPPARAA